MCEVFLEDLLVKIDELKFIIKTRWKLFFLIRAQADIFFCTVNRYSEQTKAHLSILMLLLSLQVISFTDNSCKGESFDISRYYFYKH